MPSASVAAVRGKEMRSFWDRRARENALFYVDNRLDYSDPDTEAFWDRGEEELRALLDAVGASLSPGDRVVEIGCGVGRLTRVLARDASHVSALDVSEEMLELARRHNPGLENVEWMLGDGESLAPLPDGSADACVSHVVFQHIPDPAITLGYVREMGRVLAPNGWAAFQISNLPEVHKPRGGMERVVGWLRGVAGRGPKGQLHPAWRGSAVALEDLRVAASESGLAVDQVAGSGTQYCIVKLVRP